MLETKPAMIDPFVEVPARLGWNKRFGQIIFWPDAPSVSFSLTPVFPGCSDQLAEREIVWDLWRLMESIICPGAYSILNCVCGLPYHAGIEDHVCVSHPKHNTIIWEIDFKGLRPAVDEAFGHLDGFLRLVFEREAYEADVRAMLHEVQQTVSTQVPISELSGAYGYAALENDYPGCRQVLADLFEPTVHGDCDAEEFLELDPDIQWERAPIFAPNTMLEIGSFGQELFRIDGQTSHEWIERWFTRWQALAAFRHWSAGFTRRFALSTGGGKEEDVDPNEFVLEPGYDAEICHRFGETFAETMLQCLSEGETAPGIQVRYVRCEIPAS